MENVGKKKERKIRRMREQKPKPLSLLSKKKNISIFTILWSFFKFIVKLSPCFPATRRKYHGSMKT